MNMKGEAFAATTESANILTYKAVRFASLCATEYPLAWTYDLEVINCHDHFAAFYYDLCEFTELVIPCSKRVWRLTIPILELSLVFGIILKNMTI